MNAYYGRDTRRRIRSAFFTKGDSVKHITGLVIYGYLWNKTSDQWILDEPAAAIVRRIYAMIIALVLNIPILYFIVHNFRFRICHIV